MHGLTALHRTGHDVHCSSPPRSCRRRIGVGSRAAILVLVVLGGQSRAAARGEPGPLSRSLAVLRDRSLPARPGRTGSIPTILSATTGAHVVPAAKRREFRLCPIATTVRRRRVSARLAAASSAAYAPSTESQPTPRPPAAEPAGAPTDDAGAEAPSSQFKPKTSATCISSTIGRMARETLAQFLHAEYDVLMCPSWAARPWSTNNFLNTKRATPGSPAAQSPWSSTRMCANCRQCE